MELMRNFFQYQLSLTVYIITFCTTATLIWIFGTKITTVVDTISIRTGLGKAFAGLVFLAFATSLPEVAISVTATLQDNPVLATSNLLGGIVLQTALLVMADAIGQRKPLTFISAKSDLIFQGMILIVLLGLVFLSWVLKDKINLGTMSFGSILILITYMLLLLMSQQFGKKEKWKIQSEEHQNFDQNQNNEHSELEEHKETSNKRLYIKYFLYGFIILIAGIILSQSAEGITRLTPLSASFVGATLVAFSSSLPEVSTTFTAARIGSYSLAISNILGSNAFCVVLLFLADTTYIKGSIFQHLSPGALLSSALGIIMTTVYIIGILEFRDKSYLRLGFDSWIVLILTCIGLYYQWILS